MGLKGWVRGTEPGGQLGEVSLGISNPESLGPLLTYWRKGWRRYWQSMSL